MERETAAGDKIETKPSIRAWRVAIANANAKGGVGVGVLGKSAAGAAYRAEVAHTMCLVVGIWILGLL